MNELGVIVSMFILKSIEKFSILKTIVQHKRNINGRLNTTQNKYKVEDQIDVELWITISCPLLAPIMNCIAFLFDF